MIETSVGTLTASSPDSEIKESLVRDAADCVMVSACREFVDMTQRNNGVSRHQTATKSKNDYLHSNTEKSAMLYMKETQSANSKNEDIQLNVPSSNSRVNANGMVRRKWENNVGPYGLSFSQKGAFISQRGTPAKPKFVKDRRKSIDCSYGLKRQPTKVYKAGRRESTGRDALLPPLVNSFQIPSLQVENVIVPSGYIRNKRLSGQDSDEVRTQSTESRTGVKVLPPTSGMPNRRPASVDSTNSKAFNPVHKLQRVDTRTSLNSGKFSLRNGSAGKQSNSNSNSLKNAPASRPMSANRNSFNNLQTARQQYDLVSSTRPDMKHNSEWIDSIHGHPTARSDISRGSNHKLTHNKRTHSVYSPSSISSTEKLSARLHFSQSQRRASLPNSAIGFSADVNKSPEFFKAFSELTLDSSSQKGAKNSSEIPSSTDKSSTSAGLSREVANRRDLLQRIEEVTPENSFNLSSKFDSALKKEKSCSANDVKQTAEEHARDEKKSVEKDANNNDEPLADNLGPKEEAVIPNELDTNLTQLKNETNFAQSSQHKVSGNISVRTDTKQLSSSQSFFHVPEAGKSNKVTSRLQHCKEISKNEENRHFLYGAPDDDEDRAKKYFDSCGCYSDKEDIVDISTVYENDDDLCDEDFCRKRIIMWLMDVQTGRDAEQVVRNTTPPPSPEPGTHETAIVVIYNENGKVG